MAFADTHRTPPASLIPFELSSLQRLYCVGKGDHGGKLSLAAALRVARGLVSADSHGRGLNACARSRSGRSEKRTMAAAAGALGRGVPAAALSALLRAHVLAPRDAAPVIDAATLLSEAGRGRAALARLDAAFRLKAPKTQPFGISWKAVSLANRGQAQILTHQFGAAAGTLRRALKAAPLLHEAEQDLAVAEQCAGKKDATQYFLGAVGRQTFAKGDYVGETITDPFGELNEAEVLDTSRGRTLTLPSFQYPRSMDEGRAQRQSWLALENQIVHTDQQAAIAKSGADTTALSARLAKATPATRQRTQDILTAGQAASSDPQIAAWQEKAAKIQSEFTKLQLQGYGQSGCINAGLHPTWLGAVQAYDTAQRTLSVLEYRRQTALAANLHDPLAHQVALDTAHQDVTFNLFLIVDAGNLLSGYDAIATRPHPPEARTRSQDNSRRRTAQHAQRASAGLTSRSICSCSRSPSRARR